MGRNASVAFILIAQLTSLAYAQEFVLRQAESPTEATPQIIGGNPADPDYWPASFLFNSISGERCTATVIGPKVVLTAAHCIDESPTGVIENTNVKVTCTAHYYYQKGSSSHDLALCLASEKIRLKNDAPYEILSTEESGPNTGRSLSILGYGCTETGSARNVFYQGSTKVKTAPKPTSPFFETEGASVCFGDSGGAAYAYSLGSGSSRRIVGVASKLVGEGISRFSVITNKATQKFIDTWTKQDPDSTQKDTGVKICGIDNTLHNCNY